MSTRSRQKVALFIDGPNLYTAARTLEMDIDYKKLLAFFEERGSLVRAYYYTALADDQDYSPIRPLVDWLDYNGFTMVTKPAKEYTDAAGRKKMRGNMDVEIAVDVMDMAEHVDQIILFSGDADFRRLIEAVQRKGARVSVVSTLKSRPPMVADELRRQADEFIDLKDLVAIVGRSGENVRPHDDHQNDDYEDDYEDEFDEAFDEAFDDDDEDPLAETA